MDFHRKAAATAAMCLLAALPASAAPRTYVLEPEGSHVRFETDFGPDRISGAFGVVAADMTLDFDAVRNCRIAVTLDVQGATASFPFAAQAMRGPRVLDAARHPQMTFVSTAVRRAGDGAVVDGLLTLRGVTRPVRLTAELYRTAGTAAGRLDRLTVILRGSLNRSEFGADGWSDMVADEVRIDIRAAIRAAP